MTKWLAGNPGMFEVPGLGPDGGVGIVSPKNLTPDTETGLGSWTDDQILLAILDGMDDEGKALFPIMPYYVFHNMKPACSRCGHSEHDPRVDRPRLRQCGARQVPRIERGSLHGMPHKTCADSGGRPA
jgi:hypothetical protein